MIRIKRIGLITVVFMLCMLTLCSCSGANITSDDFALIIAVEKNTFSQNEDVSVQVEFNSLVDEKLSIKYSGSENIESIVSVYYVENGEEFVLVGVSNSVDGVLSKYESIIKTVTLSDLSPNEYEIMACASFYYNDNLVVVKSEVVEIKVEV